MTTDTATAPDFYLEEGENGWLLYGEQRVASICQLAGIRSHCTILPTRMLWRSANPPTTSMT